MNDTTFPLWKVTMTDSLDMVKMKKSIVKIKLSDCMKDHLLKQ